MTSAVGVVRAMSATAGATRSAIIHSLQWVFLEEGEGVEGVPNRRQVTRNWEK